MKKAFRYILWFGVAILILVSWLHAGQAPEAKPLAALNGKVRQLAEELSNASSGLDAPTRSASCKVDGGSPDHACTPGAVFPDATLEKICAAGYAQTVRSVTAKTKKQIYERYGFAYPQARGTFEADHLVPLELGGSNDLANLWPEAATPVPGFKEKDLVENYLHEEACAGNIGLAVAQQLIADDWIAVYQSLTPEEIQALRSQFLNWSSK